MPLYILASFILLFSPKMFFLTESLHLCDVSVPSVCEQCQDFFQKECPSHGPPLFVRDAPAAQGSANRAALTVPPGLEVFTGGDQVDVRCVNPDFPKGAVFGPYEGELVSKDKSTGSFSWIVS